MEKTVVKQRIPVKSARLGSLAQNVFGSVDLVVPGQDRRCDVVIVLVRRVEPGDVSL
jgi:hypothetical protein